MALTTFHHGITSTESSKVTPIMKSINMSVIGLVSTSDAADDTHYPNDTPVLLTGITTDDITKAGDGSLLQDCLRTIKAIENVQVVVLRLSDVAEIDNLDILLTCQSRLGVTPKILGAPEIDTPAMTRKLVEIAKKRSGFVYASPRAENGDFAKTVLMPGDPLRAKFIAETFLEDPRLVTDVRGMYGYTGTYQGRPISVMGSGMGMPSIGIYSYELYSQYGVENIIRVGSAGSYTPKAKIFDVVLATGAYSESNYAVTQSGDTDDIQKPSEELNNALRASAKKQGIPLIEGTIHSSDVFYREDSGARPTYWEVLRDEKGCLAVEMESFALFHNAKVLGKHAACILTISDSFVSPEITTAEERQTSFTAMMKVALGAVLE